MQDLTLCLNKKPENPLQIRLDVAIEGTFDVIQWTISGSSVVSTPVYDPILQESAVESTEENRMDAPEAMRYVVGFDQFFLRTSYIDLNPEVIGSLTAGGVNVKIVSIGKRFL